LPMKSKKLMKLGRSRALAPTLDWLETRKAELERVSGKGDLLDISFAEWCKTVELSTMEGLKPVSLFPWQEAFADLILGENPLTRRTITLLSSRQTGKTSILLLIASYLAQTRRQFNIVVIHRTTADAHLLCRRLKLFLGKVSLKTDSLSLLEFKDSGSQIHFRSANPNKADGSEQVGRGLPQISLAIFDEAAHSSNLKDCVTVLAPALTWSQMGLMVFIGTASSRQSYFYETLTNAAKSEENLQNLLSGIRAGDKEPFQVLDKGVGGVGVITHWQAIERFKSEPNFLGRIQSEFDLSDAQIATEYQLDFENSVDQAVFDFGLVMAAQSIEIEPYSDSSEIIYFGIDAAAQGKDFAVCIAIRQRSEQGKVFYEVCDMYRKRAGVSEQHLNAISQRIEKFRPIAATVERNNMGELWLENLVGLGLHCDIQGFSTTATSKPVLVGRLQVALERGVLKIPKGSPIIDELLAYRRLENGRMEAGGNAHDDTVIALSLALHAAQFNR